MKIKNLKQKLLYVMAVGVSIFLLFFMVTCAWIGYEVKNICWEAQRKYDGDCTESLSTLLKDKNREFRTRNDAIWALGQLGDSRALPVLRSFYTGDIPEREPYDGMISQYELKKAINLTSGGVNISAFIWRGFLSKE